MSETIVVPEERGGLELDEFLCLQYPGCPKGFLRNQVRSGAVLVDGVRAHPSQRLRPHQVLILDFEEPPPRPPIAPKDQLALLFENADVLVVDKPAGLAVEPERWARDQPTVAGGLVELARERGRRPTGGNGEERYRVVHRLDKGTSGCLVVARNLQAERELRRAFEEGRVRKHYRALVEGELPLGPGEVELIDRPIGPDARRSGRMVVTERGGKPARTEIEVLERFRGYTLVACRPATGRTHQIRVHLASLGFPLAVDPVYGRQDAFLLSSIKVHYKPKRGRPERPLIARLTLHAQRVAFPCPRSGEFIEVEAPLPKDLANTLRQLRKVRAPR